MDKSAKILYVVEGEIEENFLSQLKKDGRIKSGKIKKINIMQVTLRETYDVLSRKVDWIYCIIDTDCIEPHNINTLICNIKQLTSVGRVVVLVQNINFESELLYMLDQNSIHGLCTVLNLKNASKQNLKSFLAEDRGFTKKITEENLFKYCARPDTIVEMTKKQIPKKARISIAKYEIVLTDDQVH